MSQRLLLYTESNFEVYLSILRWPKPIYMRTLISPALSIKTKLWVRMLFEVGDSPSALFNYLFVNFHRFVSVAF